MKIMEIFTPLGGYGQFHMFSKITKFLTMPPRPRVKIGNVEGRLIIAEQYRQHGALWDIIVNGIKRNPELSSYHTLVTNSVRRRVRDNVHREVR